NPAQPEFQALFRERLDDLGLEGVGFGSTLEAINGVPARGFFDLTLGARDGSPLRLRFSGGVERTLTPLPSYQQDHLELDDETYIAIEHLLGLTPVMAVIVSEDQAGYAKGLRQGDIFARLGSVEYPREDEGMLEIRRHAGRTIDAVVLRRDGDALVEVPLALAVSDQGTIGFGVGTSADDSSMLSTPPRDLHHLWDGRTEPSPASSLPIKPGDTVLAVGGTPVSSFAEIRAALLEATTQGAADVPITFALPLRTEDGAPIIEEAVWSLRESDVEALHALGWRSPLPAAIFEPAEVIIRTANPVDALAKGIEETGVVMGMTYLTFARLFEGTVEVTHLKGPVGIA
ncbi:MAG: hypothetical protein KDA28_06775, partial [Phycisphaerales bacterium]|nr:hypothetical protein [Phycisphaerales bacterium]